MAAGILPQAPAVASSPAPSLSAFSFGYWRARGDYRIFEVVAADHGEACRHACTASNNDDTLHTRGARHTLEGVTVHPLRGDLDSQRDANYLAAHFPVDPRD